MVLPVRCLPRVRRAHPRQRQIADPAARAQFGFVSPCPSPETSAASSSSPPSEGDDCPLRFFVTPTPSELSAIQRVRLYFSLRQDGLTPYVRT